MFNFLNFLNFLTVGINNFEGTMTNDDTTATVAVTNYEFHPLANAYPLLEGDDFEEFKASLRVNGQKHEIELFEGKILDGRNRYRACKELGIEPTFKVFVGTTEEAAVHSDVMNLHRRHLTRDQKRAVIAYKLKENPDRSDRSIAAEVKVDHKTVAAVREQVTPVGENPQQHQAKREGKDGRKYKAKKIKRAPVSPAPVAPVAVTVPLSDPPVITVSPSASPWLKWFATTMQELTSHDYISSRQRRRGNVTSLDLEKAKCEALIVFGGKLEGLADLTQIPIDRIKDIAAGNSEPSYWEGSAISESLGDLNLFTYDSGFNDEVAKRIKSTIGSRQFKARDAVNVLEKREKAKRNRQAKKIANEAAEAAKKAKEAKKKSKSQLQPCLPGASV